MCVCAHMQGCCGLHCWDEPMALCPGWDRGGEGRKITFTEGLVYVRGLSLCSYVILTSVTRRRQGILADGTRGRIDEVTCSSTHSQLVRELHLNSGLSDQNLNASTKPVALVTVCSYSPSPRACQLQDLTCEEGRIQRSPCTLPALNSSSRGTAVG